MIRAANAADISGIIEIWNPIIRDTAITFTAIEKSQSDVATYLETRPVFVADRNGIIGFASYGPFRGGDGYRKVAEHTIMISQDARGRGVGKALLTMLEDHARAAGISSLWAGISAENPGGAAFHAANGFEDIARLPQVGFKFERSIDLLLMQKRL